MESIERVAMVETPVGPGAQETQQPEPRDPIEPINGEGEGTEKPQRPSSISTCDSGLHGHIDFSKQRKIVLCFDGTGNKFHGDDTDSNIVRIYELLDRTSENQFHYYQPGIGTYVQNESTTFIGRMGDKIKTVVDQAVGTSFKTHVIAGYSFIMKYYNPGDCIYIFGFSRGAYTARFLSEMLAGVGLLSRGNEEMIEFGWKTFSAFQTSRHDGSAQDEKRRTFMRKFKKTFSRSGVNVHFLGLFDCVNSVGQLEPPFWRKSYSYIPMGSSATHIRHAVSVHERRLKFKPALYKGFIDHADLKEVYFCGNHGDVGGGWGKNQEQRRALSDIPLAWMLEEVRNLPNTENKLDFTQPDEWVLEQKAHEAELKFEEHLRQLGRGEIDDVKGMAPHDPLSFGGGLKWYSVLGWWTLEVMPFISRLEYEHGKWVPRYWPPNFGAMRDIPADADIHPSLVALHEAGILKDNEVPKLLTNRDHYTFKVDVDPLKKLKEKKK
ncbi:hypothetical protein H072_8270 [Dactylellina haptotyla CBS 200.50]|uniref:T6SS Phospholipase effector Tle1-like catalytic domain-containing protein n=1 Tax=Dactylellina haptotyla (strain CBS 200.50) TaxID=1284197 RepID=S8A4R5_DACHA|nr:hypothetical protein H072_8270 [Dactylellina haptotyla CBS 200.50]